MINNPAVTDTERIHNHELRSQLGDICMGYIWILDPESAPDLDTFWSRADECGIGANWGECSSRWPVLSLADKAGQAAPGAR